MHKVFSATALAAPLAAAIVATALPAGAQSIVRTPSAATLRGAFAAAEDPNRAMLGISTSSGGRRDTLGLLITSVTAGSPAEKAGLEEGNRLVSINGVNLRLSREDADDEYMQGVNQNRLTREMRKVKAGDEVSLDIWAGGRSRSMKVKTVSADDLSPRKTTSTWATREDDRAALGLYLATTGNRRDTVGVFVQQVVEGGPAEKAGIVEGDRIASINGVDLRIAREDAGDWSVSSSRVDRMEREIRKLTAGQAADLVVVSGGRSRTVKVNAVKASDLPGGFAYSFRSGPDGGVRFMGPNGAMALPQGGMLSLPRGEVRIAPKIRIQRNNEHEFGHDYRDFTEDLEKSLRELKFIGPQIRSEIRRDLERDLPRAFDLRELKDLGPRIRAEIEDAMRDVRVRRYDDERIVIPSTVKIRRVG
jgi:S1-C subfamily serine protease